MISIASSVILYKRSILLWILAALLGPQDDIYKHTVIAEKPGISEGNDWRQLARRSLGEVG